MLKEKLKAFIVHLLISIVIVCLTLGLIIYFWYPLNYLHVSQFVQISILVIGIDLVMGPLLTFVIYNTKKESLKTDLAIIALLQFSALGFGGYTLFQNHPLYVTFTIDRYTIVTAQDADPQYAKFDEYKISKISSPKLAFAASPKNIKDKNKLILGIMSGEKDLDQRTDLYKPYLKNLATINSHSIDSNRLFLDRNNNKKISDFFHNYNNKLNDLSFLPINGKTKHMVLVINKKTGRPISTIDVDPWKYKG
jgi:hypothetical protein